MKAKLLVLVAVLLAPLAALSFETPSTEAIQGVLSDPASVTGLIGDATFNEAADVVIQVFAAVDESSLSEAEKTQFIALLIARVMRAFPEKAELAGALLSRINADWKPIVAAAAVAAVASADVKESLASEADAVADPEGVLGTPLYRLIVGPPSGGGLLGTPGGSIGAINLPPPPMSITALTTPGGDLDEETRAKFARIRAAFPAASEETLQRLCVLSTDDLNRYLNLNKGRRTAALNALRQGDTNRAIRIIRGGGSPPVGGRYDGQ